MKIVLIKKSQSARPTTCPWLIDFPTEGTDKK
jgi:hypothetical protein